MNWSEKFVDWASRTTSIFLGVLFALVLAGVLARVWVSIELQVMADRMAESAKAHKAPAPAKGK